MSSSYTTDTGPESTSSADGASPPMWGVMALYIKNTPLCGGWVAWLPPGERVTFDRTPGSVQLIERRAASLARTESLAEVTRCSRATPLVALTNRGNHVLVEVLGAVPEVFINRKLVTGVTLAGIDDIMRYEYQAMFRFVHRRRTFPALDHFERQYWGPYGRPDAVGLVTECREGWELRERLAQAARLVDADGKLENVLLTGGTGSGKDPCARGIHKLSPIAGKPLIMSNTTTITPSLVELELFGSVRNVTHGNMPEREGLIGAAEGGTLFLDELGAMAPALQAKLLQVLETGLYSRVGEPGRVRKANVRFISATNAPHNIIRDLFRRHQVKIEVPPFDLRRDDIPLLISYLLSQSPLRASQVKDLFKKWPRAVEELCQKSFPEGIRELRDELWAFLEAREPDKAALALDPKRDISREELLNALSGGVKETVAAERLGITRDRVHYLKAKYGLR
jgi:transcriptional regulator with AAA-type ATPase domain